ncbi:hypothetical protein [Rathayibacter rathayi]|uniref:Uncharacterized protein n=1 Tax=Rathayibacter rathayi TaxID=33887 RepID=A0ABX5A8V7_RATRA|nr:hypothetical protein [Rathayibacter rathayi]PPF19683.1 hypothetical protein C5C34_14940 [Rathayibacter rathayi]PPF42462.1 hypothetical protein C5C08_14980 [Rathayibacter rathayi]PPF75111.1 hypothetical protein C5C14_15010 [Rathayibacter rathayi]PPG09835.1 hypothetical protein C5C11_14990 [Rathayibacter rathayi]PPG47092.1 hypothetical protein C5C20_02360 [Rathayibacter rathayi]
MSATVIAIETATTVHMSTSAGGTYLVTIGASGVQALRQMAAAYALVVTTATAGRLANTRVDLSPWTPAEREGILLELNEVVAAVLHRAALTPDQARLLTGIAERIGLEQT